MQKSLWILAAALLGCLSACGDGPAERAEEAEETRAVMAQIYAGLQVALPASADLEAFGSDAKQAEVSAALARISDNADLLEAHAKRRDEHMQYLARSVARDAREVKRTYDEGRSQRAAFLLRQITENCVLCHTRLPDQEGSQLARGFVDDGVFEELPPEPRATLQIATRRFDDGLATLEGLLVSTAEPAAVLLGPLTDYLVLCIRVKQDFARPVPTLQAFSERPDLWTQLRRDVESWIAALPVLERRVAGKPSLAKARALMSDGKQLVDFPEDRSALAHFVAASSVLQRFVDTHRKPDRALAEAFYLMGVIEARIGRNYWVTPSAFLLERAIRLAPEADFADDAFALLERETFGAYEGSDWEDLPAEDAARLNELRAMVDQG